MENNFNELHTEICTKAKEKGACADQYKRALSSKTEAELLLVISDNLGWCSEHEIVSHELFSRFTPQAYLESGIASIGKDNVGYRNTGDRNTGHRNTGDRNTGHWNTGHRNTGDRNTGHWNTGHRNTGDSNTGDRNTGHWNTGDRNTGHRNTGHWNTGNRNTGYSNTGDRNTGAFCSIDATFPIFNKPSDWTEQDFLNSRAYSLLCDVDTKLWVQASAMTEQEKENNKGWKLNEGFYRDIPFKQSFTDKWRNWSTENREAFTSLPNFDWDVFKEITGVEKD